MRVAFVGVGRRGLSLVRASLALPGIEITAVADLFEERVHAAQALCAAQGAAEPVGIWGGPEFYRRAIDRSDVDAVVTATPWEWHALVMNAAMRHGKYGMVEVPAAVTVDECWELVETHESTGMPVMLMENDCYRRDLMAIFKMIRAGVIGEVFHCEAAYNHDVREVKFDQLEGDTGSLEWRGWHSVYRNGHLYPTHQVALAALIMDVNRGTRIDHLVSMSSPQHGMTNYIRERFGGDHPNARRPYRNGDVNITLLKLENGKTLSLSHDTQSWRPADEIHRYQGTRGILEKPTIWENGRIFSLDWHWDASKPIAHGLWPWHDLGPLLQEFDHPMWKSQGDRAESFGDSEGSYWHGASDYMTMLAFYDAVRGGRPTPLSVYDAVTWSVIAPLSEQSVAARSKAIDVPDFTRGAWQTAPPFEY